MNIILPEILKRREILQRIMPFIEEENIILLTGARQTGKTHLLYLIIRHLWHLGIAPSQIIYFDLENIHDSNLLNGLKDFNDFHGILAQKGIDSQNRAFVFVDEIQHLDHPSSFLKYLHDHNKPQLKFIVTGSSSLEIKKKFTDRLTGRVYNFPVKPLSFREYLLFRNQDSAADQLKGLSLPFWVNENRPEKSIYHLDPVFMDQMDVLIREYLIYGGYPGVTLKNNPLVKQKDLQKIYSLYVRRDIRDLGNIADITGYNQLVSMLSLQIGNLVVEQELSSTSGLSRPTVKKYLFLLENTYVIDLVAPFFTNKRKEIAKTPKVFFEDVGLRNGVLNNFHPLDSRTDSGAVLENFIFTQLNKQDETGSAIRFWRSQNKSEVDFIWQESVDTLCPIEVKLKFGARQAIPSGLKNFINAYAPERAYVIHLGKFNIRKFKDTTIYVLPAWVV